MKNTYFPASSGTFLRKSQSYMSAAFKHLELSFGEAVVLVQVCDNPGTTQDAIAHQLSLDAATVARSLKQLEQNRLIYREVDLENQRFKKAYPTVDGQKKMDVIVKIMDYWAAVILDGLSPEEIDNINSTLFFLRNRALTINTAQAAKDCLSALAHSENQSK